LSFILIVLLKLANSQTRWQADEKVRIKGPAITSIQIKSGKAGANGLLETEPLELWCMAVNPRNRTIPLEGASFQHDGKTHKALINKERTKASVHLEQVYTSYAGHWYCNVRTKQGPAIATLSVSLPPVIFGNTSFRVDEVDKSKFIFEGSGITVTRGEDVSLECPVFGIPKPTITWKKNGEQLISGGNTIVDRGGSLLIKNATESVRFTCEAVLNANHRSGNEKSVALQIHRLLRVKSELSWLFPLLIILALIIILATTIVLCEMRKRRREQKLLILSEED